MIRHHEGALKMVDDLFESYGALQDEDVYKFVVGHVRRSDDRDRTHAEDARRRRKSAALNDVALESFMCTGVHS